MAEGKEKAKKDGTNYKLYGIAAVVLIAALAAFGYYGGFFNQPAIPPASNSTTQLPLATPEARLLLASFDRGAALEDYELAYMANDNSMKSNYTLARNGSDTWIQVQGTFGKMTGFFGKDNSSDVVCLEYESAAKCALAGNNTDMADIAASLKILQPTSAAYLGQKDDTRKLIAGGAIKLASGMSEEKVGQFDTQKITYTLDFSTLTVQQMISLGRSPNDENLLAVTDQLVTFWIDKKTGLMVKSHATYKNRGTPGFFDTEYSAVSTATPKIPDKPGAIVATEAFVDFYSKSTSDYAARASCFAKTGAERYSCLKSIAVGKNSWETCKLIDNAREYESCTLIIAQNTRNHILCGTLSMLGDECYIAVAGETGNFELCKNLKNQSLGSACNEAATAGQRLKDEEAAAQAKLYATRNCKVDSDCRTFGNANQYCEPKNSTKQFANQTGALYACLNGAPCGCQDGFCGFDKNDTYYACTSKAEDAMLEAYIKSLMPGNSTNLTKQKI